MKSGKIKSVFLALIIALLFVAIGFGLLVANGGFAYADDTDAAGNGFRLIGSDGNNFIYSAEFAPNGDDAEEAGLVFGVGKQSNLYWVAAADVKENKVKLYRADEGELKAAAYQFNAGEDFKITLVVNGGIAKIFIDNNDVAVVTCKLDDYAGGKLGLAASNDKFSVTNVMFTDMDSLDGDIFFGGYEVLKVVNLTDGNYILSGEQYSVSGGTLTISEGYLKTLEANTEYVFRAVTAFTDFNFKVITDFTAVTATPSLEKYYRDSDVTIELSGNIKVHKLLIDGKECPFTQSDERVVISSEEIGSLSTGKHSVKLFTDKGRPEITINVSEIVETVTEPVANASHIWLLIDCAIFSFAITSYILFSAFFKRRNK